MVDSLFQFLSAVECSAADHASGDQCKEPFDLVQPGTAGGGEVKVETAPLLRLEPALHLGAFVGAVVVHDEMHLLGGRELLLEMIQKFHKLTTAVARLTSADDFAVQNVERGEQSCRAMPLVVVRLPFWQTGP